MNNQDFETKKNFSASDFELVQRQTKIKDTKFESKPTTFLKDSIKRFSKNKSSIVGAFILGLIILLSIIVPIVSPHNDLDTIRKSEQFLAPKLFETGTGWWDGTKEIKDQIYNEIDEVPAGYYKPAVTDCVVDTEYSLIDQASQYGKGGYVNFVHEHDTTDTRYLSSYPATFTASGNYTVDIVLHDKEDVNEGVLGEYRVKLTYKDSSEVAQEIVLKNWSKDYSSYTLDISKALTDNSIDAVENASVTFELKNETEDKCTYLLIKSVMFNATDDEIMSQISFDDATKMVLIAKTIEETPVGYWTCTGRKGIHESQVIFCTFRYDTYAAAYDPQEVIYAASDLKKLEEQKICKLTYTRGDSENFTFTILNPEKCPLDGVSSIQLNKITGKLLSVTGQVYRYKKLGYDEMPKFLFGTDDLGHDLFTKTFASLRLSLILGFAVSIVCLTFGLIWGSISGYFGGNVDLFMERITDVLYNIPSMVILMLMKLHFGDTLFVFFVALILTGWIGTASLTRTQFYRFKGREYVLSSRTLGATDARLIFKHILPNSLGTLITSSVFMVISVILSESSLSFLNIGIKSSNSFGVMIANNQQFLTTCPNLVVVPAVIISLMFISFNLFGNGLRDAVNPSLKGSD